MLQYLYTQINDDFYLGIITILDTDAPVKNILKKIKLNSNEKESKKKIVIDLAFKTGFSSYRFVESIIDKNGSLILEDNQYILVDNNVLAIADNIVVKNELIVGNSILKYYV